MIRECFALGGCATLAASLAVGCVRTSGSDGSSMRNAAAPEDGGAVFVLDGSVEGDAGVEVEDSGSEGGKAPDAGRSEQDAAPSRPPAACRSQCEPNLECVDLEPYDPITVTRAEGCDGTIQGVHPVLSAYEGRCEDGTSFLLRTPGDGYEVRYYDGEGEFIALAGVTDEGDEPCVGRFYWPEAYPCRNPVFETVICGASELPDTPFVFSWSQW